jgi:hypothetical protein
MGLPLTGALVRQLQAPVPYSNATVWGTGVNPVHAINDNPPRNSGSLKADISPAQQAINASPGFTEYSAPWGYNPEDISIEGVGYYQEGFRQDDWPSWDETTRNTRDRIGPTESRPWGESREDYNALRAQWGGAYSGDSPPRTGTDILPNETVSEGWVNKPASGMHKGMIPNAKPADDSQVFVVTSMVQRNKTLNNTRALQRGTDEPRTSIKSRIVPMKEKIYSGEERHYDMFPRQIDQILRPFKYRTAGTGPARYMVPNNQYIIDAIQRTPPADPSSGEPDTSLSQSEAQGWGYSDEDTGYY